MKLERRWTRNDDVFADEMADGIFLLSDEGEVFIIDDPVGKFLWKLLATESITICGLVKRVRERFTDVHSDVASDVRCFVKELAQAKLVTCDGT